MNAMPGFFRTRMIMDDKAFIIAVVQRCSVKKLFGKILQNAQENTCARVSF